MDNNTLGKRRKVVVVGAGAVGSTFCYALAQSGLAEEVAVIDQNDNLAQGQVLDLLHGQAFFPTVSIRVGNPCDYADASLAHRQRPARRRRQAIEAVPHLRRVRPAGSRLLTMTSFFPCLKIGKRRETPVYGFQVQRTSPWECPTFPPNAEPCRSCRDKPWTGKSRNCCTAAIPQARRRSRDAAWPVTSARRWTTSGFATSRSRWRKRPAAE
jgi:hypothetical protein